MGAIFRLHLAMPHRRPPWPYEKWVGRAREVIRDDERLAPLRTSMCEGAIDFSDSVLPGPIGTTSIGPGAPQPLGWKGALGKMCPV